MEIKDIIAKITEFDSTTPKMIYSETLLELNLEHLIGALKKGQVHSKIHFAVKSCYNPVILKYLANYGLGCEIISELEFDLVIAAGFKGDMIISNACGLSPSFMDKLTAAGALIQLDSLDDIIRLSNFSLKFDRKCRLGLRVRPKILLENGSFYDFGKLGLESNPFELHAKCSTILANKNIVIETLAFHVGQNEINAAKYESAITEIATIRNDLLKLDERFQIKSINIGGGLSETRNSSAEIRQMIEKILTCFKHHFGNLTLILEPGRYIIGSAGLVATRVISVKEVGNKTYILVDAGTNVLIPISTANYRLIENLEMDNILKADIVDGITNPNNVIVKNAGFKSLPKIDEVIVLGLCGAYTSSMASFWVYDLMPICWLSKDGEFTEILSAEKIQRIRNFLFDLEQ